MALATKLQSNQWDDRKKRESAQAAFLTLNSNVKGMVLRQLGRSDQIIQDVTGKWPVAMQLVRSLKIPSEGACYYFARYLC